MRRPPTIYCGAGSYAERNTVFSSVKRNRARRLCWESFRLLKEYLPVRHLILIPRRKMENRKRPEVTRELAGLLFQAGLIPEAVAVSPPEC